MATDGDSDAAAILIFVTSCVGLLANSFISISVLTTPSLRSPFVWLLWLEATAQAVFAVCWGFYFAPTLFFNIVPLQDVAYSSKVGQLFLMCYDISIYTHLVVSVNRFTSIFFPGSYGRIFTDRVTHSLVFVIAIFSFAGSFILPAERSEYLKGGCVKTFSASKWMMDYPPTCNPTYLYYAMFIRAVVIVGIVFAINSATFIKMNLYRRRATTTGNNTRLRSVERSFIRQVTLQGVCFTLELLTYFLISKWVANRWINFLLTSYAFILVQCLDGTITLLLNAHFRNLLLQRLGCRRFLTVSRETTRMVSTRTANPTTNSAVSAH